jgi:hypothetical protein
VVVVGGVPGLTVVVAAVAVVVIVAIVDFCSWLKVAMLEQCVFAGGSSRGSPL